MKCSNRFTPAYAGNIVADVKAYETDEVHPAYAGNMSCPGKAALRFQVQPRVCGEYIKSNAKTTRNIGSTPRMRGISVCRKICDIPIRFTPAYAGNIFVMLKILIGMQVQPRVCGEYFMIYCFFFSETGSTPRMRGI